MVDRGPEDRSPEMELAGVFDLHVHSSPDLTERLVDDFQMAQRAAEAGMYGFVLKSHYTPTADRALLMRKAVPSVRTTGSVVLNHFVGGLNPLAVEAMARVGGQIVFMPTSDAANETRLLEEWPESRGPLPPYLRIKQDFVDAGRLPPPINLLNKDGQLDSQALAVLEVVRDYDLVLATGHIGWDEIRALVPAATALGIARILVTHPESPSINLSVDQQLSLVEFGAFMERCVAYMSMPGVLEATVTAIHETDPGLNVLSSDLGPLNHPYPDVGLALTMRRLVDQGVSPDVVRRMTVDNPRKLVG